MSWLYPMFLFRIDELVSYHAGSSLWYRAILNLYLLESVDVSAAHSLGWNTGHVFHTSSLNALLATEPYCSISGQVMVEIQPTQ
jgi:hypothetical protein